MALTQRLTEQQLKQNIDALLNSGMDRNKVQEYVNNYKKDTDGSYVLNEYAQPQEQQPQEEKKTGILDSIANALTSSEQKFGDTLGQAMGANDKQVQSDIETANKNYMDAGNKMMEAAKNATDQAKRDKYIQKANEYFKQAGSTYQAVLPAIEKTNKQILGEAAGVALDVATAGTVGKAAAGMKAGRLGKAVNTVQKTTSILKGAAQAAKEGTILGAGYSTSNAMQENKSSKDIAKEAITGAMAGGIAGGALGAASTKIANVTNKANRISKVDDQINNFVGKVTQGDKKQIAKAREALHTLDTKKVKTFEDLKNITNDTISSMARKQDEIYAKDTTKYSVDSLGKKMGSKEQNFVKQAINQLKRFYDETENLEKFASIEELEQKITKEGITAQEVNNLAREYNIELANKAFSKTGEPLTSINKVASENVRKGLKGVSKTIINDPAAGELDKHMSDLFTLKATSEKLEDAVQKLQNKVNDRGLVEKITGAMGKVAKKIPIVGSGARGFMSSLLDSNVGNKSMNSLLLEKQLAKNLKDINKLNKKIDKMSDKQIIDYINALFTGETEKFVRRQVSGKAINTISD